MKKINWWIDPFMLPIVFIGFLVGYVCWSFSAGFALSEYTFDPGAFYRRYRIKRAAQDHGKEG